MKIEHECIKCSAKFNPLDKLECHKCAADIARELRQAKSEIEELTRSGQQDPSRVQIAAMIFAAHTTRYCSVSKGVKHALAVADALLKAAKIHEN
jgi:hypothetical protein